MNEIDYFDTQLGIDIWNNKYRNEDETFDQFLDRVSGGNRNIKNLIVHKKFMFGGRILANRRIEGKNLSYSNCAYRGIDDDSIESIYKTNGDIAKCFSWSQGLGVDCSTLAPRGAKINNAAKETTGAVSFMPIFNETAGTIGAEGRRAALLLSLSSDHPDLPEFIDLKTQTDKIRYANISIQMHDDFMNAVMNDHDEYDLKFTRYNGETFVKSINPRSTFMRIAENNYNWSEPGIQFIDNMRNYNHMVGYEDYYIAGTNACSELALPEGGTCLLGSMNLAEYIDIYTNQIRYDQLHDDVMTAVHAMNEVLFEAIEQNRYPLEYQKTIAKKWRQIGLGCMGFADLLMYKGVGYESLEAKMIGNKIAETMQDAAIEQSIKDAQIWGEFEGYDYIKTFESPIILKLVEKGHQYDDLIRTNGLCNASLLSIAPTGSISTMLNVAGGIEPHYALSYRRKTESLHDDDKYYDIEIEPLKYAIGTGIEIDDKVFITSKDISVSNRIDMQYQWQMYIDTCISSTINLPFDSTVMDIFHGFFDAWSSGLKGVTFHREGSHREGILTTEHNKVEQINDERGEWKQLSEDIIYYKRKVYTGCGKISMFIGWSAKNNRIEDFWIKRSGQGGCEKSLDNIAIAMSGMLRLGGNLENIERAFEGVGTCNSFTSARRNGKRVNKGKNCGDAMLIELMKFKHEMCVSPCSEHNSDKMESSNICPECGEELLYSGGCVECSQCGYTRCD